MDVYSLSDKGIAQELGHRIRALRLRKNITQQELAGAAMLSLNAIKSLESGRSKLSTLIAVLRELGALEQLDRFLPDTAISPMQLASMQGKQRERATGERGRKRVAGAKSKGEPEW